MHVVVGTDAGTSHQIELDESQQDALSGLQIGDEFEGGIVGIDGYTLEITGGSDAEGFPMRESLAGTGRRRILVGDDGTRQQLRPGERRRKSFRGNTVSDAIIQVNASVVEAGSDDIKDLLADGEDADEGE